MNKDSSMEQKTWQIYSFGKRNVFRLDATWIRTEVDSKQSKTKIYEKNTHTKLTFCYGFWL